MAFWRSNNHSAHIYNLLIYNKKQEARKTFFAGGLFMGIIIIDMEKEIFVIQ
jgi:hypothetical protein